MLQRNVLADIQVFFLPVADNRVSVKAFLLLLEAVSCFSQLWCRGLRRLGMSLFGVPRRDVGAVAVVALGLVA